MLIGILAKVQETQKRAGDRVAVDRLQVRAELQADRLAGVWANRAREKWQFSEPGDVEAVLQTASAVGDGWLQRAAHGYGLKSGYVASCNTFRAEQL